ncbi:MAG: putative mitochondrion protein [Olpidium bornovanus]|uniref:Mitochondrion protein n=1 Tax=Olpidium bornovanus TaxID=278681 RepID=A0A8H8DIR7_9FUNG|nr:MAG: putative mitochondrion protein [Olpidium bornovanus]
MRELAPKYADDLVLVIGGAGESCREIAHALGFRRVALTEDVLEWNPSAWPFAERLPKRASSSPRFDFSKENFAAIFMFHDSRHWGQDLQISLDILRSDGGRLGTLSPSHQNCRPDKHCVQSVPLYLSNPDVLWANDFPTVRMAQGAFRVCLEKLYQDISGSPLKYTPYGKPIKPTYDYAERMLEGLTGTKISSVDQTTGRKIRHIPIYAVGDNPASDIAGARQAGWRSFLVRTGVYNSHSDARKEEGRPSEIGEEFPEDEAAGGTDWVVDDVYDAPSRTPFGRPLHVHYASGAT